MRHVALPVCCLLAVVTSGVAAQEQTLDETLVFINTALRDNGFQDHEGKPTVSQVKLVAGGKLVVEIAKTESGNRFTNVLSVALGDLDVTRVKAHQRSGHTVLSLGATGLVTARLKCVMAAGTRHEWDLPSTDEVAVEFAPADELARTLTAAFVRLITLAREDTRYRVSS
jgi:hypothetical protein